MGMLMINASLKKIEGWTGRHKDKHHGRHVILSNNKKPWNQAGYISVPMLNAGQNTKYIDKSTHYNVYLKFTTHDASKRALVLHSFPLFAHTHIYMYKYIYMCVCVQYIRLRFPTFKWPKEPLPGFSRITLRSSGRRSFRIISYGVDSHKKGNKVVQPPQKYLGDWKQLEISGQYNLRTISLGCNHM